MNETLSRNALFFAWKRGITLNDVYTYKGKVKSILETLKKLSEEEEDIGNLAYLIEEERMKYFPFVSSERLWYNLVHRLGYEYNGLEETEEDIQEMDKKIEREKKEVQEMVEKINLQDEYVEKYKKLKPVQYSDFVEDSQKMKFLLKRYGENISKHDLTDILRDFSPTQNIPLLIIFRSGIMSFKMLRDRRHTESNNNGIIDFRRIFSVPEVNLENGLFLLIWNQKEKSRDIFEECAMKNFSVAKYVLPNLPNNTNPGSFELSMGENAGSRYLIRSRIQESFTKYTVESEENKRSGTVDFYDVDINTKLMATVLFTNPLFKQFFTISEVPKPLCYKIGVKMHFYPYPIRKFMERNKQLERKEYVPMKINMSIYTVDKSKTISVTQGENNILKELSHGDIYVNAKITDIGSLTDQHTVISFLELLLRYCTHSPRVNEILFRVFVVGNKSTEKAKKKKNVRGEKPIDILREKSKSSELLKTMFTKRSYGTFCSAPYMPRIVDESELSSMSQKEIVKNVRKVDGIYLTCPSGKYLGINNLKEIICCYDSKKNIEDWKYDVKNLKHKVKYVRVDSDISSLFQSYIGKYTCGMVSFTSDSNVSFLTNIVKVFLRIKIGEEPSDREESAIIDRTIDEIRRDMISGKSKYEGRTPVIPSVMRQELFDYTDEEIKEKFLTEKYFDPRLFYRAIEEYYGINIYILRIPKNSATSAPTFIAPRCNHYHIPSGKKPRCIVVVQKWKDKMYHNWSLAYEGKTIIAKKKLVDFFHSENMKAVSYISEFRDKMRYSPHNQIEFNYPMEAQIINESGKVSSAFFKVGNIRVLAHLDIETYPRNLPCEDNLEAYISRFDLREVRMYLEEAEDEDENTMYYKGFTITKKPESITGVNVPTTREKFNIFMELSAWLTKYYIVCNKGKFEFSDLFTLSKTGTSEDYEFSDFPTCVPLGINAKYLASKWENDNYLPKRDFITLIRRVQSLTKGYIINDKIIIYGKELYQEIKKKIRNHVRGEVVKSDLENSLTLKSLSGNFKRYEGSTSIIVNGIGNYYNLMNMNSCTTTRYNIRTIDLFRYDPFVYKDGNVLFLVQNLPHVQISSMNLKRIDVFLELCVIWNKERINLGKVVIPRKKWSEKVKYTIFSILPSGELFPQEVVNEDLRDEDKPICLLRYKLGETSFYSSLLLLN